MLSKSHGFGLAELSSYLRIHLLHMLCLNNGKNRKFTTHKVCYLQTLMPSTVYSANAMMRLNGVKKDGTMKIAKSTFRLYGALG